MKTDTLFGALDRAATLDKPGAGYRFLDRKEQETWRCFPSIAERAARIAGGLWQRGVRPGDTVAIVLPTSPDFIDVFFACSHMGAIPVPLYPPVRLGRLDEYYEQTARMLQASQAKILLTDARAGKLMGKVLTLCAPPLGLCRVDDLTNTEPLSPHRSTADDIAMVQFSSGTTGKPKPVALTHSHVLSNAHAILGNFKERKNEEPSGVSWLPLYHDMGLVGCVFPAVLYPGPLTLIPPEVFLARPAIWLRTLSRYRGMISPAPNFAYALCVERIRDEELEGCDLSSWRYALNGAEPIAPKTLRAFIDRFAAWGLRPEAMTPVYGLSEAALAVTFSDWHSSYDTIRLDRSALMQGRAEESPKGIEITCVGQPLPGFDIEIRNKDGERQAENIVGRLWARGPSVMDRYLDDTPPPKKEGWLDTGDLGFIRNEALYITGRAKDVIVIRGRNHAPHELEAAVDRVEGMRIGCAAAVGDLDDGGERIIVFVETRGAVRDHFAEECRQAILGATGIDPDLVIPLSPGTLPRTSSGKIRRTEALLRWKNGSLIAPETVSTVRVAGAVARSLWTEWQHRMSRA
jgi:acyl-CoA synthetase (AMP-forming)/AMP-acid ligase II